MTRYIVLLSILLHVFVKSDQQFSSLLDDIFKSNETYQTQREVSKTGNTIVCWIGTINEIKYTNGTTAENRELSIIFETQNSSKPLSIDKTEHKFNTQVTTDNFTININKSIICGVGDVLTKVYTKFGYKERLEIDIGTTKLEQVNLNSATKGYKENLANNAFKHLFSLNHTLDKTQEKNGRVKKDTENAKDHKNIPGYNASVTIKLYKSVFNTTENNTVNILIDVNEQSHVINLNQESKPINVSNKSVAHAWNKLSKILAYKLFEEHKNKTKINV